MPTQIQQTKEIVEEKKIRKAKASRCSSEQLWHRVYELETVESRYRGMLPYPPKKREFESQPVLSELQLQSCDDKLLKLKATIEAYRNVLLEQKINHTDEVLTKKVAHYVIGAIALLYAIQFQLINQNSGIQAAILALCVGGLFIAPSIRFSNQRTNLALARQVLERDIRSLGVSVQTVKVYLYLPVYWKLLRKEATEETDGDELFSKSTNYRSRETLEMNLYELFMRLDIYFNTHDPHYLTLTILAPEEATQNPYLDDDWFLHQLTNTWANTKRIYDKREA